MIISDLVSGAAGGVAIVAVGHPFDTVKIRLQTQPSPPMFNGMIDCFVRTFRNEGFGGLYRGVGSPLSGQIIFRATLFATYGQTQTIIQRFMNNNNSLLTHHYFMAAAATGVMISLIESPIDFLKSQMQAQIFGLNNNKSKNVYECLRSVLREYGVKGLYQGFSGTVVRNFFSVACFLGSWDWARNAIMAGTNRPLTKFEQLSAGAFGGINFWLWFYPLDVIKSSLQSQSPSHRVYASYIHCVMSLYNDGGWKRFYRGFTPTMTRAMPANAACFFTVTQVKKLFD